MQDYFEHFGIKRSFKPDLAHLRQKYISYSRSIHPDHQDSGNNEEAGELMALSNKAYATLTREVELFPYLLQLHGLTLSDVILDSEFLMEMMELNEEVAEARLENEHAKLEEIRLNVQALQVELRGRLEPFLEAYDLGNIDSSLDEVRTYCLKTNYLNRVISNLTGNVEL